MNNTDQARNYDTRDLARKLESCPTPQLAIRNIKELWHCSRSTVDRFKKAHGLRSDGLNKRAQADASATTIADNQNEGET